MAISAIPQLLTGSRLPILCTVKADDGRLLTLGEVSTHGCHVLLDWADGLLCAGTVYTDCTRQLIFWAGGSPRPMHDRLVLAVTILFARNHQASNREVNAGN